MHNRVAAYVLGGVLTLAMLVWIIIKLRRDHAKGNA